MGPAWAMSLFEDNAEYAYGYLLGQEAVKNQLAAPVAALAEKNIAKEACEAYLEKGMDAAEVPRGQRCVAYTIAGDDSEKSHSSVRNEEFLTKKSVWAFGGDGWAYDTATAA